MPTPPFLLVRATDFVTVGVDWKHFELSWPSSSGTPLTRAPEIISIREEATITLILPPQAIAEDTIPLSDSTTLRPGQWFRPRTARLAAPSEVFFSVPRIGTTVELSVSGLLALLRDPGRCTLITKPTDYRTRIEMPWGLTFAPGTSNEVQATAKHHAEPQLSPTGVASLWTSRLMASDGNDQDARLTFLVRSWRGDEEGLAAPALVAHNRKTIFDLSRGADTARVSRLEVSSLGGSLSAEGHCTRTGPGGRTDPVFDWQHRIVLARDKLVRATTWGRIFPFGHRAKFDELSERAFRDLPLAEDVLFAPASAPNPDFVGSPGGFSPGEPLIRPSERPQLAGLYKQNTLEIVDRSRSNKWDKRRFPFNSAEMLETFFSRVAQAHWIGGQFFVATLENGNPLRLPVKLSGRPNDVIVYVPLIFVSEATPLTTPNFERMNDILAREPVFLNGVTLDVVGDDRMDPNDVLEVESLVLQGVLGQDRSYSPAVKEYFAKVPALKILDPDVHDVVRRVTYGGPSPGISLSIHGAEKLDFTSRPQRSGALVAPTFVPDAISRSRGPVNARLMRASVNQTDLDDVFKRATLLGMPLSRLIDLRDVVSPSIHPLPDAGRVGGTAINWSTRLRQLDSFVPNDRAQLVLSAVNSAVDQSINCSIQSGFTLNIPAQSPFVSLDFDTLKYSQTPGRPAKLEMSGIKLRLGRDLRFFDELAREFTRLTGGAGARIAPQVDGISVSYAIELPSVSIGLFVLKGISANVGAVIPYSDKPMSLSLGFGSRENPFAVAASLLGGGGYVNVGLTAGIPTAFEVSIEFGGLVEVNFAVIRAEAHALGGLRLSLSREMPEIEAFVRLGASVEILGLISASVEVIVKLKFVASPQPDFVGRAQLILEVGVLFFSEQLVLDTGEWKLRTLDVLGFVPMMASVTSQLDLEAPIDRELLRRELETQYADWTTYRNAFR